MTTRNNHLLGPHQRRLNEVEISAAKSSALPQKRLSAKNDTKHRRQSYGTSSEVRRQPEMQHELGQIVFGKAVAELSCCHRIMFHPANHRF